MDMFQLQHLCKSNDVRIEKAIKEASVKHNVK